MSNFTARDMHRWIIPFAVIWGFLSSSVGYAMKASIGMFRRLTSNKVDAREKGDFVATPQMDELDRAGEAMQDMRQCYDRLLAAAASTANSAYEFSESLGEMGSCLERIAPHNDEESSRVLFMLGKVQSELQRLLDTYRSHVFKTITLPSEALLKDLKTVEDMKEQCDEKRNVFEMAFVKDKGRTKGSKGDRHIPHDSRPAYNEFHEEATMCIFRLKSLKKGQARSLLTQAVRHHTAQMRLFYTGLKSLEAVERQVRVASEKQHIDCDLSVHENEVDTSDDDDDDDDGQYNNREGDYKMTTHSAPLFPGKKPDLSERLRQTNRSSNAYVLPTPNNSKYSKQASNPKTANQSARNIWHSSPFGPVKSVKDAENNSLYSRHPRPSTTDTQQQHQAAVGHAFSGPIKPSSSKPVTTTTTDVSSGASRPLPTPLPEPQPDLHSSVSPTTSPPPASPRTNELHKLPRPPRHFAPPTRQANSSILVGHSAPLTGWNQERHSTVTFAPPSTNSIVSSPLPVPPSVVPRSYSIPLRNRGTVSRRAVQSNQDGVASSPFTPVGLSRPLESSRVAQTNQIRGVGEEIER